MKPDETRKGELNDALSIICFSTILDNDARIVIITIVEALLKIVSQGRLVVLGGIGHGWMEDDGDS